MINSILDKNSPVEDISKMGGKAQNLYLMQTQGVNVPEWICLSSDIFIEYFEKIKLEVEALVKNVDINNLEQIKQTQQSIESLFLSLSIDSQLLNSINEKLPKEKFFAVRSSAVGEDGHENSYAGQLSTFLFVKSDQVAQKVLKCWASAFSERVIQYNLLHLRSWDSLKVAVIIQTMVNSERSGVLFTVNPLMSRKYYNQAVITAGYGVGEGVVADRVETDTYIYDRIKRDVIKSEYSEKNVKLVMGKNGGLVEEKVSSSKRKSSVLNHKNIGQLVSVATSLYKFYGHEIDMEWAYDKSGKLFITQARPITTLGNAFLGKDILLDNSNVVESFPGINTPWTLSVIRDVYSTVFTNAVIRLGISKKRVEEKSFVFNHLIATHQGRVFYNLTSWYEMMRLVPYTEGYIKVWEEMLGVESNQLTNKKKKVLENIFYNPLRVASIVRKTLWIFFRLDSQLKKLDKKLQKDFEKIWRKDKKGIYVGFSPGDFMLEMEAFKHQVFKDWDITLINDIYAFVCTAITKNFIKKLKIDDVDNFFNDLLFGISGMESVAPVKSLVALGKMVQEDKSLKKKLEGLVQSNSAAVNILTQTENELKFRRLFTHHLTEFGDRGVEELKLETVTFREDPLSLLKMILEYSETLLEALDKGENSDRRKAAQKKLNSKLLTHPFLKIFLPYFLKKAIRSINYRENFRLHRSRGYGVMRRLSNYLGQKLASLDLLENPRDVYLLDYDEVLRASHALDFATDFKDLVKSRKRVLDRYKEMDTASRYKFDGLHYTEFVTQEDDNESETLSGQACSSGQIEAEVLVVEDIAEINKDASIGKDKILVAKMTDPGWVFLMTVSKGLIVEKGSILSHTAIIGRELGIPTIVGVKNATKKLKSRDRVRMDGHTGKITIIKE